MKEHGFRLAVLGILTLTAFLTSAAAQNSSGVDRGLEIEKVEVVPDDIGNGDDVYVGARVVDSEFSIEEVWFEVYSQDRRVARKGLWDSNSDDYYASPVSFEAEGGNDYRVEIKACNVEEKCRSREVEVSADCEVEILDNCVY